MASEEEPSEDTTEDETTPSSEDAGVVVSLVSAPFKWLGKQWYLWTRDLLIGAVIVIAVAGLATVVLGVWPPMGAVSSGSMEPDISVGDAVVFSDIDRFQNPHADENGVVTKEVGKEHNVTSFGDYGIVISFKNPNAGGVEIIHRPIFYVEEGENWVKKADSEYLMDAESCNHLDSCPAPHAGYITKGDNNDYYDQAQVGQEPIKPEWITGTVEAKVPEIGWLRVLFA
jgi:signal peptidase